TVYRGRRQVPVGGGGRVSVRHKQDRLLRNRTVIGRARAGTAPGRVVPSGVRLEGRMTDLLSMVIEGIVTNLVRGSLKRLRLRQQQRLLTEGLPRVVAGMRGELTTALGHELTGLPDNEVRAASHAVCDSLAAAAPISVDVILDVDLRAELLATWVRERAVDVLRAASLS